MLLESIDHARPINSIMTFCLETVEDHHDGTNHLEECTQGQHVAYSARRHEIEGIAINLTWHIKDCPTKQTWPQANVASSCQRHNMRAGSHDAFGSVIWESHHEARRFLNLRGSANFPWWTVRMNRRPSQKINKFCYLDALEVSDWMERCMEGGATFLTSVFASLCNVRNIFILRELHYYRCLLSQPSTNVDWRKVQDDGGTRKGRFCSCYGWRWSLVVVSRCVAVIDWCHFWKKFIRTGFCGGQVFVSSSVWQQRQLDWIVQAALSTAKKSKHPPCHQPLTKKAQRSSGRQWEDFSRRLCLPERSL